MSISANLNFLYWVGLVCSCNKITNMFASWGRQCQCMEPVSVQIRMDECLVEVRFHARGAVMHSNFPARSVVEKIFLRALYSFFPCDTNSQALASMKISFFGIGGFA